MTKAKTNGQRRRDRKARKLADDFDIGPTEVSAQPRNASGKFTRAEEDPRRVALSARCRAAGKPDTRQERLAMASTLMGHDLGRTLTAICGKDEALAIWAVYHAWDQAVRIYKLRYLGVTGDPQGAAIAMIPDRMETDQGHSIDLRSAEERDRAAVNNWMRWNGYLGHLDKAEASILKQVQAGLHPLLFRGGAPTLHGIRAAHILRKLADVVASEPTRARG